MIDSLAIGVKTLNMVLEYMYLNKVTINKEDLKSVAEAAKQLGVEDLYSKCIKAHLSSLPITEDSALKIWVKASDAGQEDIAKKALSFALKHYVRIQKKDSFKALSPDQLEIYIAHPDLASRSPEERLTSVLTWLRADTAARTPHLPPFLGLLPLARMAAWYLDGLLEDPIIKATARAVEIIRQAQVSVSQDGRRKADTGPQLHGERCLLFVGAYINGKVFI